ncbi:MAG: hypothetical protein ABL894_07375 [Hyphomicrobium sp.]
MNSSNDDAQIIAEVRERSRRFVQSVFACFALLFAALALAAHSTPGMFALPAGEMPRIAMAFLFLSSAYTLTLFVWDWLFGTSS